MKKNRSENKQHFANKLITRFLLVAMVVASVVLLYWGTMPERYSLNVGDSSRYDIVAPRSIRDEAKTKQRAEEARLLVPEVTLRSDGISKEVMVRVEGFAKALEEARTKSGAATGAATVDEEKLQAGANEIVRVANEKFKVLVQAGDARSLISMDNSRFLSVKNNMINIGTVLMSQALDATGLTAKLNEMQTQLQSRLAFFPEDAGLVARLLKLVVQSNVVHDATATAKAREDAYQKVLSNPVIINRGTRLVSQGDIITSETMTLLVRLNLTDTGQFDYFALSGLMILALCAVAILAMFFRRYGDQNISSIKSVYAIILALMPPLLISAYIGRTYALAPPVTYTVVVIAAYFGFKASLVASFSMVMLALPLTGYDPAFPLVAISSCLVVALLTSKVSRQTNYAKIVGGTIVVNVLVTLSYGLMQREIFSVVVINLLSSSISVILGVISAIGVMPLFEVLLNTVSPLRLIELSQTSHPLMKRLFIEAPGTSQHSMMVANLSDTAAEAIGANSMIARIGAYYHDVGKLEAPLMFTENQTDYNQHDSLEPLESASIITRHPNDGVILGKKHKLPLPILKIINEHHGTTVLQYFYMRAKELAERSGEPEPLPQNFCYPGPIPTSRESGVVMLADSVEAAVKSTGCTNFNEVEALIRRIVKAKNDQNQLVESGLAYADVETIIRAFLQVYAGHFHERVKYNSEAKK